MLEQKSRQIASLQNIKFLGIKFGKSVRSVDILFALN